MDPFLLSEAHACLMPADFVTEEFQALLAADLHRLFHEAMPFQAFADLWQAKGIPQAKIDCVAYWFTKGA